MQPNANEYRDLPMALARLVHNATVDTIDTSVPAILDVAGTPHELPAEVNTNLFRITQEALANAQRYANASRIQLSLTYSATAVKLFITDNGIGFEVANAQCNSGGFGLSGMRQRAERICGRFKIFSAKNKGTRIIITVPFKQMGNR